MGEGGGGRGGAESTNDGEKAWSSINYSILTSQSVHRKRFQSMISVNPNPGVKAN
jgi:hypothetical protein